MTASTARERRDPSIYLATYPAMQKCFQNFDVGFFDLFIADESHRSITIGIVISSSILMRCKSVSPPHRVTL